MRLKLATQHAHARIEQRMLFDAPHFDVAAYRQLLGAFHGFYRPLEEQLAAPASAIPDLEWGRRIKLPWLALDLQALGTTDAAIESLPTCDRLPELETPPLALGCLYVLEGSTLGGQVVQRLLSERLGAPVAGAVSFFRSYGRDVGVRWRSFLGCLEGLRDADSAAEAEQGALSTFHALETWLEQRKVLR